jgi:hypothetical protein
MRAPPEALTIMRGSFRPRDLLANDRPHRPANESEIHDRQNHRNAVPETRSGQDAIGPSHLRLCLSQPLGVGLQVTEAKGIAGGQLRINLGERPFVNEKRHVVRRGDSKVESTMRTHLSVLSELFLIEDLAATRTFLKDIARKITAVFGLERFLFLAEPGHTEALFSGLSNRRRRHSSCATRTAIARATHDINRNVPP